MIRLLLMALTATVSVWASADDLNRETLEFNVPQPGTDLVGEEHFVHTKASDSFADIAAEYAVGYRELEIANARVDPWLPGDGTLVVLPQRFILPDAPHNGIVLNTAEMRLYYYPAASPRKVFTFPVSVGRGDWQTPVGTTQVVGKTRDPAWYPPQSVRTEYQDDGREIGRVVPPGPDNPLGQYALDLALPGYLIHGTNHPFAIGMQVTHGCIRLHPRDIALLYHRVKKNTPVTIVYQPFKAGWQDDILYLEAHPPLDVNAGSGPDFSAMVDAIIHATTKSSGYWVNWEYAREIARNPDGLPHAIGKRRPAGSETTAAQELTTSAATF